MCRRKTYIFLGETFEDKREPVWFSGAAKWHSITPTPNGPSTILIPDWGTLECWAMKSLSDFDLWVKTREGSLWHSHPSCQTWDLTRHTRDETSVSQSIYYIIYIPIQQLQIPYLQMIFLFKTFIYRWIFAVSQGTHFQDDLCVCYYVEFALPRNHEH